jgi:hypothetical protein
MATQLEKLKTQFDSLVLNSAENVIEQFGEKTLRYLGGLWAECGPDVQASFRHWVQEQFGGAEKLKRLNLCLRLIKESAFDYEQVIVDGEDNDFDGLFEEDSDHEEDLEQSRFARVVSSDRIPEYEYAHTPHPPSALQQVGTFFYGFLPGTNRAVGLHTPPTTPPQTLKRPRNDSPDSPLSHSTVLAEAEAAARQRAAENALLTSAPPRPELNPQELFPMSPSPEFVQGEHQVNRFDEPEQQPAVNPALLRQAEEEVRRLEAKEAARLKEEQAAKEAARLKEEQAAKEAARLKEEQAAKEAARLKEEQAAKEAARLKEEQAAKEAARLKEEQAAKEAARLKEEQAAKEAARLKEEQAAKEAARLKEEQAAKETARLKEEQAAKEAARLKEEQAAKEAARLKEEQAAKEAARLKEEQAAKEAARLKEEQAAKEAARLKEEQAAKEAAHLKAVEESKRRAEGERRIAAERERAQKLAREKENILFKQQQEAKLKATAIQEAARKEAARVAEVRRIAVLEGF